MRKGLSLEATTTIRYRDLSNMLNGAKYQRTQAEDGREGWLRCPATTSHGPEKQLPESIPDPELVQSPLIGMM